MGGGKLSTQEDKQRAVDALRNVRKTTQPAAEVVTGLGRSGAMRHISRPEYIASLFRSLG